jgi:SAM-dependent methyltransferase
VARFRDLVPKPLEPLVRRVYHAAYRRRLALEWWVRDHSGKDDTLPPAKLRFRVGESSDPAVFLEVGRQSAAHIAHCLDAAGVPLRSLDSVLDFGCGCGRTLRWLTSQYPTVNWHGSDVDAEAIAWCRERLPGVFKTNPLRPPLPFGDGEFDAVIGLSVFTHLDEEDQRAWVPELHRVLKPGGVLLLSFYAPHVWQNTDEAASIADGRFVFRRSAKLKGIVPDWYQTAFQNRTRIEALLNTSFDSVQFIDRGFGDHDAAAAIKGQKKNDP